MNPRGIKGVQHLVDAAAVLAALGFIASQFPASLMLSPTTTNGGDMASHFFPASFLRDVLLPGGHVTGWCPGNYAGFPLFQFYFPLPFVVMAALSLFTSLAVAFKLVSQLGTILLPLCAYASLRSSRVPFPGPALGALASLLFLFMDANSMWGGNLPSTLAGEFSFSIGFALAFLFLGVLRRSIETGKGFVWPAVLVALIGLSHGYALLWTGFASLAELVTTRLWWRRFGALVVVHGLAILLMGFWLVPLLGYARWTTAYSHIWVIKSWTEILPSILWGPAIIAVAGSLLVGILATRRGEPFPRALTTLWVGTLMGGLFYLTASLFHVVDIRFFPFLQLGLCLIAAAAVGYLVAPLPAPVIWPLVAALVVIPFVQQQLTFIPAWISWNYSGFESKPAWPIFAQVNRHLRGDLRSPRVAYEHSPDHEDFGTVRAFESLPLFAGRATLEGLYMQAAPTAPAVFYTQSEISQVNSCPFPLYGCSRLDLARGVEHLRMFNVSQVILRSTEAKAAAARHGGLVLEGTFGPLQVYGLKENDGRYVVPLAVEPALVVTRTWKETSYRWFKRARPDDPVPVFVEAAGAEERAAFKLVFDGLPDQIPSRRLEAPPRIVEQLGTDRIVISGCRPGHPLLVRMSYHPAWKARGGERVWLAAPSFMLIVPKSERVELVFEGGLPDRLGLGLSLLGLLLLVMGLPPVRRRLRPAVGRFLDLPPIARLSAVVKRSERWTARTRKVVLLISVCTFLAGIGAAAVGAHTADADGTYRKAQEVYEAGRLSEALPIFQEARRLAPMSNTAIHSSYFEAIIHYREQRWREAERSFAQLLASFPEAQAAAEAQYHVGLCRARRGESASAAEALRVVQEKYPGTHWAKYAGERLAELPKAAP